MQTVESHSRLILRRIKPQFERYIPISNESMAKVTIRNLLKSITTSEKKAHKQFSEWNPKHSYKANEKSFLKIVEGLNHAYLSRIEEGEKHRKKIFVLYLSTSKDSHSFDVCTACLEFRKGGPPSVSIFQSGIIISFHFMQRLVQRFSSDIPTLMQYVRDLVVWAGPAQETIAISGGTFDELLFKHSVGAVLMRPNYNNPDFLHVVTFFDENKHWNGTPIKKLSPGTWLKCSDLFFDSYKEYSVEFAQDMCGEERSLIRVYK